MEHLAELDLDAFWNGRLEPAVLKRALRHLIRGCATCSKLVLEARPAEAPVWEKERLPLDAYDGAIDRAWRRVGMLLTSEWEAEPLRNEKLAYLRGSESFGTIPPPDLSGQSAWARVEILSQRSLDYRYSIPGKMLKYAQKAQEEVDKIEAWPFGEKLLFDLRARVWGELANARRVAERYEEAGVALRTAHDLLDQGTSDLGIRALLFEWESSLNRALRQFEGAMALLDEAQAIYRQLGAKSQAIRTLMSKGSCLLLAERPSEGVGYLRDAFELVNSSGEPELAAAAAHNLFRALVDLGDLTEASRLLRKSGLRRAFARDPLNELRVRWVRARVVAARGRLAVAEDVLEEVRSGFRDRGLHYDSALAGLDLAHVRVQQGKSISHLAVELRDQCRLHGVNPQAVLALEMLVLIALLNLAATVTQVFIEGIRGFLVRLQHAPHLRCDPHRLLAPGA